MQLTYTSVFDLHFHMKKQRFSFHIHFKIRIQLKFLYLQANLVMSQIQPPSRKFCQNLANISKIVSRFFMQLIYTSVFDLNFHMKKQRF